MTLKDTLLKGRKIMRASFESKFLDGDSLKHYGDDRILAKTAFRFFDDFLTSHQDEILEGIAKWADREVGTGDYHCGEEACCGILTKATALRQEIIAAKCEGYNHCLKDIISIINSAKKGE